MFQDNDIITLECLRSKANEAIDMMDSEHKEMVSDKMLVLLLNILDEDGRIEFFTDYL